MARSSPQAACGDGDETATSAGDDVRSIEVDMVDIALEPDTPEVSACEPVKFVFTNQSEVAHDAFIGDGDAQGDHEADMRATDGTTVVTMAATAGRERGHRGAWRRRRADLHLR